MQVLSSDPNQDPLKRALAVSGIAHGTVLLVVVLKSIIFPGEPVKYTPALRVDMVGLPDLTKQDLMDISKALPKEAPQEKIAKPQPKEAVKEDELVLKPKKKKEDAKKQEKAREDRMESALARIRALEKVRESARNEEEAAVVIKGNKVSKGTSLSGDAKEAAEASYYDLVKDRLIENWALPPWLARQKYAAQVLITVNAQGRITAVKFLKPSGNAQFDDAIRATLKDSQPLPEPPEAVLATVENRGILLGFPL